MRRIFWGFLGLVYIADELYKWVYNNTLDGIVFLGSHTRIQHRILNTFNLQAVNFRVAGNGYNPLSCDVAQQFDPYNIFLYADAIYNRDNHSYDLALCYPRTRVDLQVDAILNITNYSLPIIGATRKCIEVFGNNSHVTSKVFESKMSHGVVVNHLEDSSEFSYSVASTIFLKLISPFVHDPFYRFVSSILISPYSSSITVINDGVVKTFHTNTSEVKLCTDQEIVSFQDQTFGKFMHFYHAVDYTSYPRKFSKGLFQESDTLPVWYKKLQEDNLELFKKLLLVIKIIKNDYTNVQCLIETTQDFDYPLEGGVTPLIAAMVYNHYHMASLFLQKNLCIDCQDQYGFTALMYAVKKQEEKMVELLLSYNADPSILDNQKQSALNMAKQLNNERIISALEVYSSNNDHVGDSNPICSGMLDNTESIE